MSTKRGNEELEAAAAEGDRGTTLLEAAQAAPEKKRARFAALVKELRCEDETVGDLLARMWRQTWGKDGLWTCSSTTASARWDAQGKSRQVSNCELLFGELTSHERL
jgi:hypothetical protein